MKKTPALSKSALDRILAAVSLSAVIACMAIGWQAMQPGRYPVDTTEVPEQPAPPKLLLNQTHARVGQTIEVNPENIGKSNPFQ